MDLMDAITLIGRIAQLTFIIVVKINETKEIRESAAELRKLVSAVQAVVTNASSEVKGGMLTRPEAIEALQGIQQSLQECLDVITKYSGKTGIVKFLFSGTYLDELKGLASSLARWLSAFHVALGVEQHADIKEEFKDLCRRLEGMQLEVLSAVTTNANGLRSAFDQASRDGRDDAQLRRVITEALKDAGVMGVASSGGGIANAVQQKEAAAAIQMELRGLREQKKTQEAEYLAMIAELLASSSGQQQQQEQKRPPPPAVQGAPSQGAGSRQPAAPPPVVVAVPGSFLCPIMLDVMRDPVILVESGHTFERTAIERHLSSKNTNPITNLPLSSKAVIPNIGLRGAIEEWLQTQGLTAEEADTLDRMKPAVAARSVATPRVASSGEAVSGFPSMQLARLEKFRLYRASRKGRQKDFPLSHAPNRAPDKAREDCYGLASEEEYFPFGLAPDKARQEGLGFGLAPEKIEARAVAAPAPAPAAPTARTGPIPLAGPGRKAAPPPPVTPAAAGVQPAERGSEAARQDVFRRLSAALKQRGKTPDEAFSEYDRDGNGQLSTARLTQLMMAHLPASSSMAVKHFRAMLDTDALQAGQERLLSRKEFVEGLLENVRIQEQVRAGRDDDGVAQRLQDYLNGNDPILRDTFDVSV